MKTIVHPITNRLSIIVAVVVTAIITILFMRSCDNDLSIAQQSKDVSDKQIDLTQVKIWQDKYNQTHYELERMKVDKEVLQVQGDSLVKLLKIKTKQLESFSHIKTGINIDKSLNVTTKTDTIIIDNTKQAIQYSEFAYKDRWIDIKGDVGRYDKISITGTDTLTRVDYWKRKWFLGKKRYYSDFSNKNPYVNIQGLKSVESQVKDKRFSIGPYIGVGYQFDDLSKPQIQFGISLQYSVITF